MYVHVHCSKFILNCWTVVSILWGILPLLQLCSGNFSNMFMNGLITCLNKVLNHVIGNIQSMKPVQLCTGFIHCMFHRFHTFVRFMLWYIFKE